jgi:hypothetical protein
MDVVSMYKQVSLGSVVSAPLSSLSAAVPCSGDGTVCMGGSMGEVDRWSSSAVLRFAANKRGREGRRFE